MQNKLFLENIERQINKIFTNETFINLFKDENLNFTLKVSNDDLSHIKAPAIEMIRRGGKRIRPLLMVLLGYALGLNEKDNNDTLYETSLLLELPHSGSLIIDDIEDNALKRRGETAVHLIYGVDNSINTGNLIYFLPTMIIKKLPLSSEKKLLIYENFLMTLTNLHLGQGIDIKAHNENHIPEIEEYISLIELKTGSLFGMAGFLAAVIAHKEHMAHNLYNTFIKLGVYFQIIDDIKNIDNGILGKDFGDDLVEGKKSLPIILFLKENNFDPKLINELESFKNKNLESIKNEIINFTEKIKSSNAIQNAFIISEKYYNETIYEITSYNLILKYKNMLLELINSIKGKN